MVSPPQSPTLSHCSSQCADDGHLGAGASALQQYRGMASRRPTSANKGAHHESAFVEEDDRRFAALGVFLALSQSSCTQRRIPSSSRSMARRVGFCGLQPGPCSSRPMWSTWYCTANRRSINSATRGQVHRSIPKPAATGPLSSNPPGLRLSFARSLGGRPGAGRARSPSAPSSRIVAFPRRTLLRSTPTRLATSPGRLPSPSSAKARKRRRSSSPGVPVGRRGHPQPEV